MIAKLDELNTQIACLIYQSIPVENWEKAVVVASQIRDEPMATLNFDFYRQDGILERGIGLGDLQIMQLSQLLDEHQQLTSSLKQPRWSKMTISVQREGKFSCEFSYTDE